MSNQSANPPSSPHLPDDHPKARRFFPDVVCVHCGTVGSCTSSGHGAPGRRRWFCHACGKFYTERRLDQHGRPVRDLAMPFAKENATLLTFLRCLAEGKDRRSTAAACGKSVSMVTAWISKLRKTIPQQHRIVTGEPPSISLTCPHCGKTGKKQRKGWNIGQRWRCTACMRTFLDPGVYTCPVCGGGKENTVPLERNEGEPHLRFCKACKSTYVLPSEAEQRRMLEEGRLAPDQRDGLAKVAGMILESLNAGTGVEAAMKNAGIDLAPWSIDRCRLPLPTPGGTWPTRQGDVPGQP